MKKIIELFSLILIISLSSCGDISNDVGLSQSSSSIKTTQKTTTIESKTTEKNSIKTLTFVTLPAPPKCKSTNDSKIIKEIMQYIENGKNEPIKSSGEDGWIILLILDDSTHISVIGNTLNINDSCYKVSDNYADGLLKIYDKINTKEQSYPIK